MLKKFTIIILGLVLCNCSFLQQKSGIDNFGRPQYKYVNNGYPTDMVSSTDYSQVDLGTTESYRVAVLLPLSGKLSSMGESMKNAATMAIGDIINNNLVVQFYDTKGTPSGARVALENAINAGCDLVLGPLTGDEVAAITPEAKSRDIPVISFSTSPSVLQEGIYSIGLLNDEQINRIIRYAAGQGRSRLALVLPDNQSGINMLKSAMKAANNSGMNVVKVGFYKPDSMDFTDMVVSMKGGFDALLIPESGNRLKAISSMFSYYDVSAPDVLFMGTSVWASSNLSKETELYGAVYPVLPLNRISNFENKYSELFGERPSGLSIFAYDAVALASSLANKDHRYIDEAITRGDGYYGIGGAFRLFENGRNEHSLDVVKVTSSGEKVVDSAPQKFYGSGYETTGSATDSYYPSYGFGGMPQFYGKSAAELQSILSGM